MRKLIGKILTLLSFMTGNFYGSIQAQVTSDPFIFSRKNSGFISDVYNGTRGVSFNSGWKFNLGDVSGADQTSFNDQSWRSLSVPHDWSIELPFNQSSPAGSTGGCLDGGIGWYRKTFMVPSSSSGKRVTIQFDGVYMNSDVYINGTHLGNRPYGYTTFEYDLTPYLKFGSTNVIAVKVNNHQRNSRWYSGSGIYRNVWLTTTNQIHTAFCGSFVTTSEISGASAKVSFKTNVQNHSAKSQSVFLVSTVLDASGNQVATVKTNLITIASNNETTFNATAKMANPTFWSMDNPYLYTVKTQVYLNNAVVDVFTSDLGIRTIAFDANKGFFINGKNVKLHGVCLHHDLGSLGSAHSYRALERQIEIMKEMGCNAIRTSHNPPAPELLEICDRLGLVVMDEIFDCWQWGKTQYDYSLYFNTWAQRDVQNWIQRDRNHTSVILWSIGNEIPQETDPSGQTVANQLKGWVHADDTTRLITEALTSSGYGSMGGLLDVVGFNYANSGSYDSFHQQHPNWKLMGSETSSAVRTRGVYHLPTSSNVLTSSDLQCSSYDNSVVGWGHSAENAWRFDKDRPFVIGQFIWTGFDYIGEPTPYDWPAKSSYFGIVDMCGFPKDIYYFYQSQWTTKPMVHILPHWNWKQGDNIPVWTYTNCDSVDLRLNGKSLGAKRFSSGGPMHLEWIVPFQSGTMIAHAYKGGILLASDTMKTADKVAKIRLKADRASIHADSDDLVFIETDVVDENGTLMPDADNLITYTISGPGEIVGVDNGNPISHESFKGNQRQAFHGKALAIVRSKCEEGPIQITASTPNILNNMAVGKSASADSEKIYNLALGKTASSDSEEPGNAASSGNDGKSVSRWCAANGGTGHWWKVDLGSNYNINKSIILWENASVYQYKIEVSTNNTNWSLMVDKTGNTNNNQTQTDTYTATTARYVRITVTNSGNYWASFFEFEVYDGVSTNSNGNTASKAVDNNTATSWTTADAQAGHWWSVDLGSTMSITGTNIVWADARINPKYKIEVSTNNSNWTLVVDKTNSTNTQQMQSDAFTANARYIKVTITSGTTTGYDNGIAEFSAYTNSVSSTIGLGSVTVNAAPWPAKPVVMASGDTLRAFPVGYAYQWFRNGTSIQGATDQVYVKTQTGSYTVQVTDGKNCPQVSEIPITTDVENTVFHASSFALFPNPANEKVTIQTDAQEAEMKVKLFSLQGLLLKETVFAGYSVQMDVKNLESGVYVVEISCSKGRATKKFIKE
jgi:beta-galactosidase